MTKSYLFAGENKSRWICYSPTSAFIWASADKTPIHGDKQPTVGVEAQKKKKKEGLDDEEVKSVSGDTKLQQSKSTSMKPATGVVGASPVNITWRKNNKALYDFFFF